MASAQSVEIPIEIFGRIIDNVADWKFEGPDKSEDGSIQNHRDMALKSCALVCRAFLPLCRKHLFKRMYIHNQHDNCIMKNLDALLRTTPEISNYVRDLNVQLYDFQPLPMDLTIFSRLDSFRLVFSPKPGDFKMGNLDFNKMEQWMKNNLLYPISTLEALALDHVTNFPFHDLPLLYPNLRELAVASIKLDEVNTPIGAPPLPSIKLDTFLSSTANNAHDEAIQKLLQVRQSNGQPIIDFSDLKDLYLFYVYNSKWTTTRRMLSEIDGLSKINIAAVLGFRLNGLGQLLLPFRTSLKEICVHITYMYLDSDPLSGLCEELEIFGAHPNVLEQLIISVTPKVFERLAGDEWKKLDRVIDRFAWPKLKRVEVIIDLHMIQGSDTDLLKRFLALPEIHLPKLAAKSREDIDFQFNLA